MDFDQLYPNRFMKAGELGGKDLTLKIAAVALEELGEGAEKKGKAIVSFERTKKQWVMNKTNGICLKAMFGRETNAWIGKRVTLCAVQITDPFTGELTLAIRVRGSPDLKEQLAFSARLGRKNANFKLVKTQLRNAPPTAPAPSPVQVEPPPAGVDEFYGEEPPDELVLPGSEEYANG